MTGTGDGGDGTDPGTSPAPTVPEPAPRKPRRRGLIVVALIAVACLVAGVAVAVTGSSGSDKKRVVKHESGDAGREIFLEQTAATGPDPFSASAATPPPSSTVPAGTPVTLGPAAADGSVPTAPVFTTSPSTSGSPGAVTVTARSGATPGLYGGTMNQSSCNKQQMIDFLAAHSDKARAWANVQGIPVDSLRTYIDGLTPVLLRSDTRVTNHGFVNGHATAHQSVLQAGTAVLVDQYGVPRGRCACGNPLLPPIAVATTPSYQGTPWSGFSPGNVTVVQPSTTVIKVITVIDVTTGQPFGRPTGPTGGPDQPVPTPSAPPGSGPTSSTSTTLPTLPATRPPTGTVPTPATLPPGTEPPTAAPTAPPANNGPLNLVDVRHTVSELASSWTVDDRAGTATLSISAGQANYSWSVPSAIDPNGTSISWGGSTTPPGANINVRIAASGSGVNFGTSDLTVDVTGGAGSKSATITVAPGTDQVTLVYSMGFSVTATYTYRR